MQVRYGAMNDAVKDRIDFLERQTFRLHEVVPDERSFDHIPHAVDDVVLPADFVQRDRNQVLIEKSEPESGTEFASLEVDSKQYEVRRQIMKNVRKASHLRPSHGFGPDAKRHNFDRIGHAKRCPGNRVQACNIWKV